MLSVALMLLYTELPPTVPGVFHSPNSRKRIMKHEAIQHTEPVGIVISSGRLVEKAPRFSAYVWSYGPDAEEEADAKAA